MQRSSFLKIAALFITIILALAVVSIAPLLAQTSQTDTKASAELKNFDSMVLQSRQEMRNYCAIVQELIKQADAQKQTKGVEHIRRSMALWEKVQQNFQSQPPAEYQQDAKFSSRLDAIHQGIQDMEKLLAEGKFKDALQACSMTCGLFVKMHEENNLVYAADRLFHLRKLAKKMIDEEQKSGLNPAKEMLGDLLKLRDNVFLAPCPAPDDETHCKNYQAALKTLSAQLDELAISAVNRNQAGAENILKNLMSAINLAYGIAL